MTDASEAPAAEAESESKPRRTWSASRRQRFHESRSGRSTGARARDARAEAELIAEEVVKEAVANVTTVAGFVYPFMPHLGATVAGVQDDQGNWLVRPRAQMAGDILLVRAQSDARLLRAIARFNRLFTNVEMFEVIAAVGASAAVDVRVLDPHATIRLPGGVEAPMLAPIIGDTIVYIDAEKAAREAQEPQQQGRTIPERREEIEREFTTTSDDGQVVIEGGVTAT